MDEDSKERGDIVESDYFAQAFIAQKFQAFDKELYATKWFDYRFMTSWRATQEYMNTYADVYRLIYSREIDRERSQYIRPFDAESVREGLERDRKKFKPILTGCWRGRQFADALGMPYREYITCMMTFRLRAWNQSHMPRPTQLYHEIDLEKTQSRWEELKSTRLWLSDNPAYLVQNYRDLPVQNDYHEWLFEQASLRQNHIECLARVVGMDQLPLAKVKSRLEDPRDLETFYHYLEQGSD